MALKSTALKRRTQHHAAKPARDRIGHLTRRSPSAPNLKLKSRPLFWFRLGVGPGWQRDDLDSPSRPAKGSLSLLTRGRSLLWSWWPWAIVCIWRIAAQDWGWAIGAGSFALVAYLLEPAALPPRFGLDHEFAVDSDEFISTMAGVSGAPFVDGNALEVLNNGDEFYPRML